MGSIKECRAIVMRPSELKSYDRGRGARSTPLVRAAIGATSFLNGITEFGPGVAIPFHSHNCEESVILLEGEAILDLHGEEHYLKAFDTTWIPPNVPHRFRNASATELARILWTYASVHATRTLLETGETRPVSEEHRS